MTPTSSKRIVLVEDNPHDVFLVRESIRSKGIDAQVVWFGDIPEAITAILDQNFGRPDLLLLDLNLPRGEGLEVLAVVRSTGWLADLPVAVLTSSESPRDQERASSYGVNAYIIKPLELDAFIENVGGTVKELLRTGAAFETAVY